MGNWENGKHHGYGRVRYLDGETKEGLFENGKYMGETYEKSGITTYNHTDGRASKVDYEKYLITNDDEFNMKYKVPL